MIIDAKKILLLLGVVVTLGSCNKKKESLPQTKDLEQEQSSLESASDTLSEGVNESVIAFKDDFYDFKDIKKGDKVSHVFYFTNEGNNPLIISEVKPSCGCTTPDYTKEPVAPKKQGFVTVTFDSSNFDGLVLKTVSISGNFQTKVIKFQAKIN